MTQVLSPNDTQIKDFSKRHEVKFRIDDDVFYGVTNIPALDLMQFGAMFDGLTEQNIAEQPDIFMKLFRLVLREDSCDLFTSRMSDKTNPISMEQVMDILPWIMGEYGMRPPEQSSSSSAGQANPDVGTSSTESAPALVSTSLSYPPLDS